ncbi:hypothetical protein P3TCK_15704 [Photobacterium profundum 3TCK]|uniref:Uncharacterized protein n=1 Tax=Photobacterium profundum 3TCK TaxID=314280 RepID=Q1Z5W7_9GAMM|nr:hypothetical protein P3TCK_15704 [Photobacterium profundum 3TCK]
MELQDVVLTQKYVQSIGLPQQKKLLAISMDVETKNNILTAIFRKAANWRPFLFLSVQSYFTIL